MSTLVTTNLKHGGAAGNNIVLNSDGSTTVSGALTLGTSPLAVPSGSAPSYTCRAWVNFDGTTNTGGFCTVRASGNVSSVADNGTGNYTINFTTALPDENYAVSGAIELSATTVLGSVSIYPGIAPTPLSVQIFTAQVGASSFAARNPVYTSVAIFR
jgi:hypothetical protein